MTGPMEDAFRRAYEQRQQRDAMAVDQVFGYPGVPEQLAEAVGEYEASGDMERDAMADAEASLAQAVTGLEHDESTDPEGETTYDYEGTSSDGPDAA